MKRSPQLVSTLSELKKHGASVLSIADTSKHIRVAFTYQGREMSIICGGNTAGWTAPDAARTAVRHKLGIARGKTTGKRRTRKSAANRPAPTCPESITLGPDPWRGLQGSTIAQKAAAIAADRAWAALMGLCLLNVGHVPESRTIRHALGVAA